MTSMLAFFAPGPLQMLIVAVIVLLLFGNRIPSVAKSLGQGIVQFKKGLNDDSQEDEEEEEEEEKPKKKTKKKVQAEENEEE